MAIHHGVVIGVVDDLDDPEGLARVKVKFPHLADEPSNWARLALPMAGAGRGTFFRPEKGDEVLVACEHGDIRQPYVLGTLWSKTDQPPDQTGAATDNNIRVIVSRSGHRITLDDTQGSERIQITDHTGKQAVVLDGSSITVSADADHVTIKSSGDVTVSADRNLNLTASNGTVKISGAQVTINLRSAMGMPAAKQNDRIVAIDTHLVQPAGPAPPVPTPCPFSGPITGGVSSNVLIQGLPAATVGSTATNTPPHVPAGGTFINPPTNQGQVISGSATVLINGKAAARNGDTAQTCNDPVPMPVGTVVASSSVLIGG